MESSDADSTGSQPGWQVAGGGVMADFHVQLVLDYFQARSSHDRTEAALARIVQHIADTYVLPATERERVQAEARGWLGPSATPRKETR